MKRILRLCIQTSMDGNQCLRMCQFLRQHDMHGAGIYSCYAFVDKPAYGLERAKSCKWIEAKEPPHG